MVASQNFHLGMIGHGSSLEGADKDIAAMTEERAWATNPRYFSLPDYINHGVEGPQEDLETVDLADGEADGKWRGHGFFRIDATPAYSEWETRVLEAIIRQEGFGDDPITDLFYINYKAPDAAGHKWNMIAPEQRDVVASVDEAIGDVVDFLDREVGQNNYVLVVTADHGQTPLDSGGWPISQAEVKRDVEKRFDHEDNGRGILERTSTALYFMNREEMEANGLTPEEVASFLTGYTIGENLPDGADPPEGYEERLDNRVFSAVIPGRQMPAVAECTGALTDLN